MWRNLQLSPPPGAPSMTLRAKLEFFLSRKLILTTSVCIKRECPLFRSFFHASNSVTNDNVCGAAIALGFQYANATQRSHSIKSKIRSYLCVRNAKQPPTRVVALSVRPYVQRINELSSPGVTISPQTYLVDSLLASPSPR